MSVKFSLTFVIVDMGSVRANVSLVGSASISVMADTIDVGKNLILV